MSVTYDALTLTKTCICFWKRKKYG